MKFKPLEINDTVLRQVTMEVESDKEFVLYAESFSSIDNTNHEFVVGLPLEVRDFNVTQLRELAVELSEKFNTVSTDLKFSIAIHSKKQEDEVHFHISYNGCALDAIEVKALFEK